MEWSLVSKALEEGKSVAQPGFLSGADTIKSNEMWCDPSGAMPNPEPRLIG